MSIHSVEANTKVSDDLGKVAIEQGPTLYCLVGTVNGSLLSKLTLSDNFTLSQAFVPNTLSREVIISGEMLVTGEKTFHSKKTTVVPHFAWINL